MHSGTAHGGHYFALLRTGEEAAAACERPEDAIEAAIEAAAATEAADGDAEAEWRAAQGLEAPTLDDQAADGSPTSSSAAALAAAGWHEFNDATVKRASVGSISAAEGRGPVGRSGDSGANCYMLLYQRVASAAFGAPPPPERAAAPAPAAATHTSLRSPSPSPSPS